MHLPAGSFVRTDRLHKPVITFYFALTCYYEKSVLVCAFYPQCFITWRLEQRSRDSNSLRPWRYGIESQWGGGRHFRARPDRPRIPLSLLYNGYRNFLGSKAAGAWYWPFTPSGFHENWLISLQNKQILASLEICSAGMVSYDICPNNVINWCWN